MKHLILIVLFFFAVGIFFGDEIDSFRKTPPRLGTRTATTALLISMIMWLSCIYGCLEFFVR